MQHAQSVECRCNAKARGVTYCQVLNKSHACSSFQLRFYQQILHGQADACDFPHPSDTMDLDIRDACGEVELLFDLDFHVDVCSKMLDITAFKHNTARPEVATYTERSVFLLSVVLCRSAEHGVVRQAKPQNWRRARQPDPGDRRRPRTPAPRRRRHVCAGRFRWTEKCRDAPERVGLRRIAHRVPSQRIAHQPTECGHDVMWNRRPRSRSPEAASRTWR